MKNYSNESCGTAWSIKHRRKKLIAQFGWKSRDERFEPN
jgi:hypothetical protein